MHLFLIGIGAGNPAHLTRAAEAAIGQADLFLVPHKGQGKSDLADLRRGLIRASGRSARIVLFDMPVRDGSRPYLEAVDHWHDAVAARWRDALAGAARADTVALLIWGDPSLFDSALRIAGRLTPKPAITVIPGLTSLQLLTAAHAIPLNRVNAPVTITTGRRLRADGWPRDADRVAVMLDGACAFRTLPQDGLHIWWGAFLGMPEEILFAGMVSGVGDAIVEARAKARTAHGWIMDTYLLEYR